MIHLVGSLLTRALREGLIVRALAWPGLLTVLAVVTAAAAVAVSEGGSRVAVSDPILSEALEARGLTVVQSEDPEQLLRSGDAEAAVWRDEGWVLGLSAGGRSALEVEAVVRDHAGAAWTIVLPPLERRDPRMGPVTSLLLGLMAVLFTLYGVVFGAASLLRDREDGTLEAERSLPLPDLAHAWARLLTSGLLLAGGFLLSVGLVHGLLGVDRPFAWAVTGSAAGLAGAAIGLGAMSRAKTLSRPLAIGMMVAMALIAGGWSTPALSWLPIASVGSLVRWDVALLATPVFALLLCHLAAILHARSAR